MLDKKEFNDIRQELEKFENNREEIIQKSREIIKSSKLIIYSLHRNDIEKANLLVLDIKKNMNGLAKSNLNSNINKVAVQEYVEALCYFEFIKNKRIPLRRELEVETEDYLCGLCDLIGELVRKAVNEVINQNVDKAIEIRNLVDNLYGEFLMFNLRNGELRKKMDSIKWNLKKLDEVVLTAKK
jgi:translin|tara:strand:+ start:2870 stop:3421 length:552 start_codon:yes stop_codon:yes gene_type:complete